MNFEGNLFVKYHKTIKKKPTKTISFAIGYLPVDLLRWRIVCVYCLMRTRKLNQSVNWLDTKTINQMLSRNDPLSFPRTQIKCIPGQIKRMEMNEKHARNKQFYETMKLIYSRHRKHTHIHQQQKKMRSSLVVGQPQKRKPDTNKSIFKVSFHVTFVSQMHIIFGRISIFTLLAHFASFRMALDSLIACRLNVSKSKWFLILAKNVSIYQMIEISLWCSIEWLIFLGFFLIIEIWQRHANFESIYAHSEGV